VEDAPTAEPHTAGALGTTAPPRRGRELVEELHHAEYPGLVRFLLLNGASWNEAQDAAQDAFTQMCRPGTDISHPKAWLRQVAWRSWLRQQVQQEDLCAEVPHTPAPHWQSPANAMELGGQERRVIELLLRLPAKQRAALAWNLDGFTSQESADAMGISSQAVRQNLARGRAALKAHLGLEEANGRTQEEER
jgi:RNA polymerase sigma factor (sigma-70 family)